MSKGPWKRPKSRVQILREQALASLQKPVTVPDLSLPAAMAWLSAQGKLVTHGENMPYAVLRVVNGLIKERQALHTQVDSLEKRLAERQRHVTEGNGSWDSVF